MVFYILRESVGVITLRIADFGFWIEINKSSNKGLISNSAIRIPKSAIDLLQYSKTTRNLYRQTHWTLPLAILDLSCGLPPCGRVPGFRMQILDTKMQTLDWRAQNLKVRNGSVNLQSTITNHTSQRLALRARFSMFNKKGRATAGSACDNYLVMMWVNSLVWDLRFVPPKTFPKLPARAFQC